ncbi:MAG: DnaB-like helicase C-terminal domain-containing protein, partial [Patescibacteria group bacterium]
REDKRPQLSDLRESGSLEQDADIVMFIHREELYRENTEKKGQAKLIVAKHRNGATGSIDLAWIAERATFDDFAGFVEA